MAPSAQSAARPRAKRRRKTIEKGRASTRIALTPSHRRAGAWLARLAALQARLRAPNGCPWDREQTHRSLRKYLIEEAYEVLDAMDSGDARKFSSELGDLLLQVVFHAAIAEEAGEFTLSDVIRSVYEKMIRRHPHVFGRVKAEDSRAVLKNWEQIKAQERAAERESRRKTNPSGSRREKQGAALALAGDSILAGVPRSLPGVLEAYQLARRASHIGFDWEDARGVLDKLDEEKRELQSLLRDAGNMDLRRGGAKPGIEPQSIEEEMGDLLFSGVNVARFLGVDPEIALKKANRKFRERFQWMESAAVQEGKRLADLPRERMEELWELSKARSRGRQAARNPARG